MIMVMAATVNCLPALKLLTYKHPHSLLTSALYRTFTYLLTYKCIKLDNRKTCLLRSQTYKRTHRTDVSLWSGMKVGTGGVAGGQGGVLERMI